MTGFVTSRDVCPNVRLQTARASEQAGQPVGDKQFEHILFDKLLQQYWCKSFTGLSQPVNSKRTGTLTQYNSPYNRMKPSWFF